MSQLAMRKIPLSKIASEIARALSLMHHKEIAYRMITEDDFHMIVGLCVEPDSSNSSIFSVHTFIQALYIPFFTIVLSLGNRIGYWEKMNISEAMPDIKQAYGELPCDSIATIIDKLKNRQLIFYGSIANKYEFLAYSYLVINKEREARDYLYRIVAFENDQNAEWFVEDVKRAKMLLDLMDQGKRKEIREQLLSWQRYTMAELKLPEQ